MKPFFGEFIHQLDAKNRIRIPARFKKILDGSAYYFARGAGGCIYVFPEEEIDRLTEKAEEIAISDLEKQRGYRAFFKSIVPAEEDTQGRVVLPKLLKKAAHIEKEIIITGAGKRMEIWDRATYESYFGEDFDEEPEDGEAYDKDFVRLGL